DYYCYSTDNSGNHHGLF
nr:immunoglobulin light chain junction region [Macaca mulatta]MOW56476.1 immunoglobulin light chain junction region [Macaca mulatta]MOW57679.1 immunoglobulin light chain junction region [Macaca mulatta]MOW58333.1 immunoglobulin light chain junction region [Macaca mulatta]MOW58732.1 immunoglobulin light chain junction region [Macaca mulatta]